MPRLSIDITNQQHQKLKAVAALRGQTLKDFVLEKALSDVPDLDDLDPEQAMRALANYLKPRLDRARSNKGQRIEQGQLLDQIKERAKK